MKRIGWLVVWLGSLGIAPVIWADAIVSFEDQGVAPGTFANNAGPGGFWLASGQAFNNNFDVDPIFGPF